MSLIRGDCAAEMSKMSGGSVDLIVTSPPYDNLRDYKGYSFDFEGTARQMLRVLKEGGVAVWVVGDSIRGGDRSLTSFRQGLDFKRHGFKMHDVMIYEKNTTPFPTRRRYAGTYEFMFVLSKGGRPSTFNPLQKPNAWADTKCNPGGRRRDGSTMRRNKITVKPTSNRGNVWKYSVGYMKSTPDRIAYGHPATFPEKLAEDHILSWSNPGDLVLDPFCGSGTTLKMAEMHGRRWIGIDVSQEYLDITRRRMAALTSQARLN